jgi:adenylate cyclase
MFVDIRDFTSFAEHRPPEDVVDYLNTVLGFVIEAVTFNFGTAHRLLGDGLVALFGAPATRGNSCQNAVEAAMAIVEWADEESRAGRIPATRLGVGIHAGEVVVGTVGTRIRQEYQVNGDVVNLASRIEKLNRQLGSKLLVSDAVWNELDREPEGVVSHRNIEVSGRTGSVDLYQLA